MYHRFLKSIMKKSISKLLKDQGLSSDKKIKPSNDSLGMNMNTMLKSESLPLLSDVEKRSTGYMSIAL